MIPHCLTARSSMRHGSARYHSIKQRKEFNMETLFELSMDTKALCDMLEACPVGETVTFEEMSTKLGRLVDGGSTNVQSAINRIESREGIVFGNIRGVGYKHLSDEEIVETGEFERTSIRKRTKRAGQRITRVKDFGSLSPEKQIEHNTWLSLFSTLNAVSKPSVVKRLTVAVSNAKTELGMRRTLEIFRD